MRENRVCFSQTTTLQGNRWIILLWHWLLLLIQICVGGRSTVLRLCMCCSDIGVTSDDLWLIISFLSWWLTGRNEVHCMTLNNISKTSNLIQQVDEVQRISLSCPPTLSTLLLIAWVTSTVSSSCIPTWSRLPCTRSRAIKISISVLLR